MSNTQTETALTELMMETYFFELADEQHVRCRLCGKRVEIKYVERMHEHFATFHARTRKGD